MRVTATINETTLENDNGREVQGVTATCSQCNYSTESYGTGERSIRRCLVLLHEECPRDEHNFYEEE